MTGIRTRPTIAEFYQRAFGEELPELQAPEHELSTQSPNSGQNIVDKIVGYIQHYDLSREMRRSWQ